MFYKAELLSFKRKEYENPPEEARGLRARLVFSVDFRINYIELSNK